MTELENLRKRKLEELQNAQQDAVAQDFIKQQLESVKRTVMQRFLTREARERLANVRIANPQLAYQIENALVEAANLGQIPEPIDEEKLKEILSRASGTKKEFRIIK